MTQWKTQTDRAVKPFPVAAEKPLLECLYGSHKAEIMHKGTLYCRSCYDAKNLTGTLIN